MKINLHYFENEFLKADRQDNFSRDGLRKLYEYLEENDEDYCLDVIELCCDYSEDKISDALANNNLKSLDQLNEQTCVVWHDETTVMYANF